jgi:hypothetical protein
MDSFNCVFVLNKIWGSHGSEYDCGLVHSDVM